MDYTGALQNYSAADFDKFEEILKEGEIAAERYLPQLQKIAAIQKANGIKLTRRDVVLEQTPVVNYNFVTDKGEPVEDTEELKQLRQTWPLKPGRYYNTGEINQAIEKIIRHSFLREGLLHFPKYGPGPGNGHSYKT